MHQIAQLLRVELGGELGRTREVAEHNRELPTLGFCANGFSGWRAPLFWSDVGPSSLRLVQLSDGLEQLLAVPKRDTELFQLGIGEQSQGLEVDVVLGEDRRVTL
jgi:hypothetical protein